MKKKLMWAVGALCLIALIVGASVLYGKLSDNYMPDRLAQLTGDGSRGDQDAPDGDGAQSGSGTTPDGENNGSGTAPDADGEMEGNGEEVPSGSGTASGEDQEAPAEDGVQPAPDFTVTNYDGEEVKLSDYFGKPVVLNFWASWCPPCKAEMPDFEEAYKNHTEVQFLMVNMTDGSRETVETAKEHVESQGYSFTVLFDTEYSAAYAYYVNSLPATYFIDAEGNLIAYATGMLDAETLERGIAMIVEQDSVEAAQGSTVP